jgi:hypothetical protein
MGSVHRAVRRTSRYGWLLAGLGVGYVVGTRAGRERYDQLTTWVRRASVDLGVDHAVDCVVDTAKETAQDLLEGAAERARTAVDAGAQSVANGIQTVGAKAEESLADQSR